MSILTDIESAWTTDVWNNAYVQALTTKIYQYPVTTDSEFEIAKLYYNQEINFFEVLTGGFIRYLASAGQIGLVYRFNITVEINYYRELDTDGTNFTAVREAFLGIFDLVSFLLGQTWNDNVDLWSPEEAIPTIVEVKINNKKCWKGTTRYFAEKIIELSGNPGDPGP